TFRETRQSPRRCDTRSDPSLCCSRRSPIGSEKLCDKVDVSIAVDFQKQIDVRLLPRDSIEVSDGGSPGVFALCLHHYRNMLDSEQLGLEEVGDGRSIVEPQGRVVL